MTADFIREIEEDIRRDRYKRLWDRFGVYIVAVVLVLVAAVAGVSAWRTWQASQAAERTAQLAVLFERAERREDGIADALRAFAQDAEGGAATLARLEEAAVRARAGDVQAAVAIWDGIAANPSLSSAYRDLATLLAAMHQLYSAEPALLAARLGPMDSDIHPYRFSARELLAVLALRQGDTAKAKRILDALAADPQAPEGVRSRAAELSTLHGNPQ
ncbi:MAG TPA: tetratricopeptide repeat protein [Azospirillaceae bacterium]|nr:tetratricopeptide repeat protein [Azospirillaceae bacterium]